MRSDSTIGIVRESLSVDVAFTRVELHTCELCRRLFTREVGSSARDCARHQSRKPRAVNFPATPFDFGKEVSKLLQ